MRLPYRIIARSCIKSDLFFFIVLDVFHQPCVLLVEYLKNILPSRVAVTLIRKNNQSADTSMPFDGCKESLALDREGSCIVIGLSMNKQ